MPTPLRSAGLVVSVVLSLAASASADSTTLRQYLSGLDKDHTVPWQFFCDAGQHSGQWATIAVPSNWELQGFGIYTYGYDISAAVRQARLSGGNVAAAEPVVHAKYKLSFNASADWKGKKVFLVF